MTAADLRLSREQESALRESEDFGRYYPGNLMDVRIAIYLRQAGLFAYIPDGRYYEPTAAGRDWLATHPTEVAR
jgi:hypothetical protein